MGKKTSRLTIKVIEEAIGALGHRNVHLYKGRGYYYWFGGIANKFDEQGVYGTFRLNEMNLNQWGSDFKERVKRRRL